MSRDYYALDDVGVLVNSSPLSEKEATELSQFFDTLRDKNPNKEIESNSTC